MKKIIYIGISVFLLALNSCKVENNAARLFKSSDLLTEQELQKNNRLNTERLKFIAADTKFIKHDTATLNVRNISPVKVFAKSPFSIHKQSRLYFSGTVYAIKRYGNNVLLHKSHQTSYKVEKQVDGNIFYKLGLISLIVALALIIFIVLGANFLTLSWGVVLVLFLLALIGCSLLLFILGLIFHKHKPS